MGWDDSAPISKMMSAAQRNLIISLREQHDGRSPGEYASDIVNQKTSLEAKREIERLQVKIADKKPKSFTISKCPFCSSVKRPCCEKNPVKK